MKLYSDPQRIRKRGELTGRYYCRVFDTETKQRSWRSTGKSSHRAAAQQKRAWESEDAQGVGRIATVPFEKAVKRWLDQKKQSLTPGGLVTYSGYTANWLKHIPRKTAVRGIAEKHVEGYFQIRGLKVEGATLNKERATMRQFFRYAIAKGWATEDPTRNIERWKEERHQIRALTVEEEEALLRACREPYKLKLKRKSGYRPGKWDQEFHPPPWLYALVFLGLRTGLRYGNLEGLLWKDVDFKRAVIRIPAKRMKARKEFRIPLDAETLAFLQEWKKQAESLRVLPLGNPGNVQRAFHHAVKRADIPRLRIHDLRATFITRCRQQGVDLEITQKLAGHANVETTLRHYRDIDESELHDAIEKLAEGRKKAGPSQADFYTL